MVRISVVLLVDPRGRVLLQERDEHAPLAPEQWGMVGGHVEDGEDFEPAAYRELEEETGVHLEGGLRLWRAEEFQYPERDHPFDYRVWVAGTTLTDADVVVGEGRQIVFVAPEAVPGLDKSHSCAHFVTAFLASATYRDLVAGLNGWSRSPGEDSRGGPEGDGSGAN
jgi:8-oxo-dGTP pyrophosphatase MutT (NUDIX family)